MTSQSTVMDQQGASVSERANPPTETDVVSVFYGKGDAGADLPMRTTTPSANSESGHSATPSASADSTEPPKTGDQPKGTAETNEKEGSKEKKVSEKAGEKEKEGGKDQTESHRAAAARLGIEVKELRTQLAQRDATLAELRTEIEKLKGTYKEPPKPTEEQIRAQAEFEGREKASRTVAEGLYGAEAVKAKIYDPGSEYEQLIQAKPWVQLEVMRHPQPAVEAMRILEREAFMAKYGDDPSKWVEKIQAEIEPLLFEKFKQSTQVPPTGKEPPTVTGSRGSGGHERERSLVDIFYGGGKA